MVVPGESSYLYHDRTHKLLRIWQAVMFTKSYNIHKQVNSKSYSIHISQTGKTRLNPVQTGTKVILIIIKHINQS